MVDLAIIGGGPGGYVAAIRGAQKGLRVLLVEKDALGGSCLNRGCIPTKCFIHDVKTLDAARTSPVLSGAEKLTIDIHKMVARKRAVVKTLVDGVGAIMKGHGIEVVRGLGELRASGRLGIRTQDGAALEVEAGHVILATGSRPSIPPFLEVDGRFVQTTDEALDPTDIPPRLLIVGGGVIGLEMAAIYRLLGSEVTILEVLPDIIMNEDEDIRRGMRRLMEQRGVGIHLGCRVEEVVPGGERVTVTYADGSAKTRKLEVDRVLAATGRVPVLDGVACAALNMEMDGPFVKVDDRLQTSLPGVYAVGDVVGGMMLAHKASAEAEAAVANILGGEKRVRTELIPRCIWGCTEIGSVGLSEKDARATGRPVKVGRFVYMNSAAAQAMGDIEGLVKIVADAETGEMMGVHILGPHATDLIGEPVMAMTMESAVEDLAEVIKPHPTLGETLMEAAMDWNGHAIHAPKR